MYNQEAHLQLQHTSYDGQHQAHNATFTNLASLGQCHLISIADRKFNLIRHNLHTEKSVETITFPHNCKDSGAQHLTIPKKQHVPRPRYNPHPRPPPYGASTLRTHFLFPIFDKGDSSVPTRRSNA